MITRGCCGGGRRCKVGTGLGFEDENNFDADLLFGKKGAARLASAPSSPRCRLAELVPSAVSE